MSSDPPGRSLRVLTVNIHKGYTTFNRRFILQELRDAVRTVGSDLVFLQEVLGEGARAARRHRALVTGNHYEYLADQIWHSHAYGRNAVADGLDHGNAVLSRYPILHWDNHDVSLPRDEPRGLLHCVVQPVGMHGPVHLVCVHLGLREAHRRHQLDQLCRMLEREVPPQAAQLVQLVAAVRLAQAEVHRRHQLDQLCRMLEREVPPQAPLIVAGDFNDWRSRADAVLQGCGLVEVFRHSFGNHARSFPAGMPLLRLDRIYVRWAASAQPLPLPRRPWAALSDHAPLAAEIRFAAAPDVGDAAAPSAGQATRHPGNVAA